MSILGLALGGGGARGLAHIGVLKVLEKEGVEIHAITGCSMGSIVGGLYAHFKNSSQVESFIMDFLTNSEFKELGISDLSDDVKNDKGYIEEFFDYISTRVRAVRTLTNPSYFSEETTDKIFSFIPDVLIEDFDINFSAIATDIISGQEINFTRGSLREVVKASSAIPGVFPPVNIGAYQLVDGSASESVPVGKVKEIGADRVLAVDVTRSLHSTDMPDNVFDILYRTADITSYHLSEIRLKEADLIIRPKVKKLKWVDFHKAEKIIRSGEQITRNNIEEIRRLVNKNSILLDFGHFLKRFSE